MKIIINMQTYLDTLDSYKWKGGDSTGSTHENILSYIEQVGLEEIKYEIKNKIWMIYPSEKSRKIHIPTTENIRKYMNEL